LLLPLITFHVGAFAQVSGTVLDKNTGEPVAGASVEIVAKGIGITTDEAGQFVLMSAAIEKSDTLYVFYLGYKPAIVELRKNMKKLKIFLDLSPVKLETTIISADRILSTGDIIPGQKTRIGIEEISIAEVGNIDRVLEKESSINIEGNAIDGKYISLRGSRSEDVNVYIDGVLLNALSLEKKADINLVAQDNIEEIQIIESGNLAIAGQGAAAGVVNIVTMAPDAFEFNSQYSVGNLNKRRLSARVGMPLTNEFSFNFYTLDDRFEPNFFYFDPATSMNESDQTYRVKHGKTIHNLDLYYSTGNGRLNGKFIIGDQRNSNNNWEKNRDFNTLNFGYLGEFASVKGISFNIIFNSLNEYSIRTLDKNRFYKFDYDINQTSIFLSKKYHLNSFFGAFSYRYFHDELDRKSQLNSENERQTLLAALTYQNRHTFAATIGVNDSTSFDKTLLYSLYVGSNFHALASGESDALLNFGLNVKRKLSRGDLNLFLTIGENIRYPSLFENAYSADVLLSNGNNLFSQTFLKPNYIYNFDLGFDYSIAYPKLFLPMVTVKATYFISQVKNLVIFQPAQFDVLYLQGAENKNIGYDLSLNLSKVMKSFDITLSHLSIKPSNKLTYVFKPESVTRLYLSIPDIYNFGLNLSVFREGSTTAWFYDYDAASELRIVEKPPFADINFSINYKFTYQDISLKTQLSGSNILGNSQFQDLMTINKYYQLSFSIAY
jgi:hypothetical protein